MSSPPTSSAAPASPSSAGPALPPTAVLGFIGGGAMASAIAKGIGEAKLLPFSQMYVSDPNPAALIELKSLGVQCSSDNALVASKADVLLLCTKPDMVVPVLSKLGNSLRSQTLIMSVAAGLSLASMEAALPPTARVVRVMPNTPALVGLSASAFTMGARCTERDARAVTAILRSIGTAIRVPEKDLNAVTGLSGSGPAYVFLLLEALADGGVRAGLPRAAAMQLATQTVIGAAKMVQHTGKHPGVLKDQVASPGGTTIAGIHALEQGHFRGVVMDAVLAAARRAKEMGEAPTPKSKL